MKFALNALPETLINMLQVRYLINSSFPSYVYLFKQSLVSLRRIEKYLLGAEVSTVPPLSQQSQTIALQSATVTWPQDRSLLGSKTPSASSTPRHKFVLVDLSLNFPAGELSLICGKLGSGKTLLLLGGFKKYRFLHSADNFSRSISFTWRSGSSCGANLVPSIASRLPRQLYRSSSIERGLGSGRYLCLRTPSESLNS